MIFWGFKQTKDCSYTNDDNKNINVKDDYQLNGSLLPQAKQAFRNMLFQRFNISCSDCFYNSTIGVPMDAYLIDSESIKKEPLICKLLESCIDMPLKGFSHMSLRDFGTSVEVYKILPKKEVNSLIENELSEDHFYVMESVMWKNMNDSEKIKVYLDKLADIDSKNKELIIIDPFIFFCREGEENQFSILEKILEGSGASQITIITRTLNNCNPSNNQLVEKLQNALKEKNILVKIEYSKEIHDRFWIAGRKKGFYTGTSFNGIGKKISLIDFISPTDIEEIVEALVELSII